MEEALSIVLNARKALVVVDMQKDHCVPEEISQQRDPAAFPIDHEHQFV